MSNMKAVLVDMTLEEFGAKRKLVLDVFENKCKINDAFWKGYQQLYDVWLELHGKEFAQRWVKYNGSNNQISEIQLLTLINEMKHRFVKWLKEIQ